MFHRQCAVPFHVEGNFGPDGENSGDRRSGKAQPLRQGVGKVMVIEHIQAAHDQVGARAVEVNLDGIVPNRDHPEYVVSINVDVVVVNLLGEVGRSNRTGVEVKSNKSERASMLSAVHTNELALAETHVGLERQPRGGP